MLICIDSSALVVGLQGKDPSATKILELVGSDPDRFPDSLPKSTIVLE